MKNLNRLLFQLCQQLDMLKEGLLAKYVRDGDTVTVLASS